jgi:AAHS family 4-hydroxybenzoate transporter-like MFS transporter
VSALFTPEFRADTIGLWAAFFSCLLSVYLAFSWVPSMLDRCRLSSAVASAGIMAFNWAAWPER